MGRHEWKIGDRVRLKAKHKMLGCRASSKATVLGGPFASGGGGKPYYEVILDSSVTGRAVLVAATDIESDAAAAAVTDTPPKSHKLRPGLDADADDRGRQDQEAKGEVLSAVKLEDITGLRIGCLKCQGVIEAPFDVLKQFKRHPNCPFCSARWLASTPGQPTALLVLAQALEVVSQCQEVTVALVVRGPGP
jgi:hypothetical protein